MKTILFNKILKAKENKSTMLRLSQMSQVTYLLDNIRKAKTVKDFNTYSFLFFKTDCSYYNLIEYASITNFDEYKDLNLLYTQIINHPSFFNIPLNSFVRFMISSYCRFDANLFARILLQKKDINLIKEFYSCCPKNLYNSERIETLLLFQ